MSLRMREAITALKFLQIGRYIEIERRPLKSNNLAGDAALAAIFQVT